MAYLVVTKIYDNGRAVSSIHEVPAVKKQSFESFTRYDLYQDFFEEKTEAENFLKQADNATKN